MAAIYLQLSDFLVDADEDTYGSFDMLAGALVDDTFSLGGPGSGLTWPAEIARSPAVATAGDLAGGEGGTVQVNGVDHVRTADGFMRHP